MKIRGMGPSGLSKFARNATSPQVLRSLFKIMSSTELCSLSTVTPGGLAHTAHVYFAHTSNLELYFLSDPESVHCSNLETNPSTAVSIYDSSQRNFTGTGDKGVALYGVCREVRGIATQRAVETYGNRFKPYVAWRRSPGYDEEAQRWRFFRFTASRIKVFDEPEFGSAVFIVASVRHRQ